MTIALGGPLDELPTATRQKRRVETSPRSASEIADARAAPLFFYRATGPLRDAIIVSTSASHCTEKATGPPHAGQAGLQTVWRLDVSRPI